jgi:hypothetical protein
MKKLLALIIAVCCVHSARAQFGLTSDGLASYVVAAVAGGGGGSACSSVVPGIANVARYWALNDATSGTSPATAADSSGNSATATIVGAPSWSAGKAGAGSLTFSSRSQYATNLNVLNDITNLTIAAWVNPSDLSGQSGHNIVVSGVLQNLWLEITTSGHPLFHYYDNNDYTDTSTTLTTGSWHHIAVTVNGQDGTTGTLKIYVDGSLKQTFTPTVSKRNEAYAISTYGPGVGAFGFIGSIDEVVVALRDFTGTEINSIATCN